MLCNLSNPLKTLKIFLWNVLLAGLAGAAQSHYTLNTLLQKLLFQPVS